MKLVIIVTVLVLVLATYATALPTSVPVSKSNNKPLVFPGQEPPAAEPRQPILEQLLDPAQVLSEPLITIAADSTPQHQEAPSAADAQEKASINLDEEDPSSASAAIVDAGQQQQPGAAAVPSLEALEYKGQVASNLADGKDLKDLAGAQHRYFGGGYGGYGGYGGGFGGGYRRGFGGGFGGGYGGYGGGYRRRGGFGGYGGYGGYW